MTAGNRSTSMASSQKSSQVTEIGFFASSDQVSGTSVRCRDKSISLYIAAVNMEITFGGEAMAQVVSDLCEPRGDDDDRASMERVLGALPGVMHLMGGSLFLVAAAAPREQGCDLSQKVHGAYVPVECSKSEEVVLARIGGSAPGPRGRAGRQARPALEVAYYGQVVGPDEVLTACQTSDVHDVVLQAFLFLIVLFQQAVPDPMYEFAKSLFIIDGMSGRFPIGDGSEEPEEFVFKQVGACFRKALYDGTTDAFLDQAASDLRSKVSAAKLLVSWEPDGLNWMSTGLITEFFSRFQALIAVADQALKLGSITPGSPLCQLERPSDEVLASELADQNSAKLIMRSLKQQLAAQVGF